MAATYQIADEPSRGPWARLRVSPTWPLLALMLAGAWLGVAWFIVNTWAIGSATKKSETALALAALAGKAALLLLFESLLRTHAVGKWTVPYLVIVPVVWELALAYVIFVRQQRSFELASYFGAAASSGVWVLALGSFARGRVLDSVPSSFWAWVLS